MVNPTRQLAAQTLAGQIFDTGAACRGKAQQWDEIEAGYRRVRNRTAARAAAGAAMLLCAECPAIGLCADLARTDHYTGLMAGGWWSDGELKHRYVRPELLRAG